MPRKVDYASRFHFFREAAFAIVRDRGVAALSRRALAEELGTSRNRVDDVLRAEADLRVLAAGEVKNRRTSGRFHLMRGKPEEVAVKLVTSLMPDAPGRIDEELVWLRLMVEGPRASSPDDDPDGPLWMRYQIAQRGYVYAEPPDDHRGGHPVDHLAEHRAEREHVVTARLQRALEQLELGEHLQAAELERLRAIVDGLTLAICLGRLSPYAGVEMIRGHLSTLAG